MFLLSLNLIGLFINYWTVSNVVRLFTQPDCRRYMPQSNLVFLEEHQLAFRSIFGDICHGKCLIESNVSEPPNLKIFWGRIPPDPPTSFLSLALSIRPPRVRKILCYGPVQPFSLTIIPFLLHMLVTLLAGHFIDHGVFFTWIQRVFGSY